MTATLAEHLAAEARHMADVREEYERTKADHALDDGCDSCTVGCHPDRIEGWTFVRGQFVCARCAENLRRCAGNEKTECINGHPWVPSNLFERPAANGGIRYGCSECRRDRSRRGHLARQAKKKAARG